MKAKTLFTLLSLLITSLGFGQEFPKSYYLSGFDVTFEHSDTFGVDYDKSLDVDRTFENGSLSISVNDQTGKVPKGKIIIYTHKVDSLYLHNCSVSGRLPSSEIIYIEMDSSLGDLNFSVNEATFDINAGSKLSVSGTTEVLNCNVGAGASVDAAQLIAQKGNIHVVGSSSVIVNVKELTNKSIKKGTFKNVYK